MAGVNEASDSFTCHPYVYPQVEWTVPDTCLYSRAAEYHRTLAGTHFPTHWGKGAEPIWRCTNVFIISVTVFVEILFSPPLFCQCVCPLAEWVRKLRVDFHELLIKRIFENRSAFGKVTTNSTVAPFWLAVVFGLVVRHRVITALLRRINSPRIHA